MYCVGSLLSLFWLLCRLQKRASTKTKDVEAASNTEESATEDDTNKKTPSGTKRKEDQSRDVDGDKKASETRTKSKPGKPKSRRSGGGSASAKRSKSKEHWKPTAPPDSMWSVRADQQQPVKIMDNAPTSIQSERVTGEPVPTSETTANTGGSQNYGMLM